jgi:hypothetical protein
MPASPAESQTRQSTADECQQAQPASAVQQADVSRDVDRRVGDDDKARFARRMQERHAELQAERKAKLAAMTPDQQMAERLATHRAIHQAYVRMCELAGRPSAPSTAAPCRQARPRGAGRPRARRTARRASGRRSDGKPGEPPEQPGLALSGALT